ncbi:MAG: hypothetical protein ACXW4P_03805 [Thermoanaerobaculia bacterium]
MSADFLDEAIHPNQCLNGVVAAEGRQFHYEATIRPLSIQKRWCAPCRTFHWFQIERQLAKRHTIARKARAVAQKARGVALAIVLGELLAIATIGIGAAALAAMR